MEITQDSLVEILVTLGECKKYLERHDDYIGDHGDQIQELRQRIMVTENRIEQKIGSGDRTQMQIQNLDALYGEVRSLKEWRDAAESRMDKIAQAVITTAIGLTGTFIAMAIGYYVVNAKPAKAIEQFVGGDTRSEISHEIWN